MRDTNKKKVFVIVIALIVILGVSYKAALAPMIKSKQIDEKIQQAEEYIAQNEFEKLIVVPFLCIIILKKRYDKKKKSCFYSRIK